VNTITSKHILDSTIKQPRIDAISPDDPKDNLQPVIHKIVGEYEGQLYLCLSLCLHRASLERGTHEITSAKEKKRTMGQLLRLSLLGG